MNRGLRLGFAGVGWIGRQRMASALTRSAVEAVAVCDPDPENRKAAKALAPDAEGFASYEEFLETELDGVVIATPSALHAEQCLQALERGLHVFCQKPLGRNAEEARRVVEAAERADRLLGVDFSYRYTQALSKLRRLVSSGELGDIYAAEFVFHNAYGPDKPWFFDRQLSGGGCVIDLGVHLVDAALWLLDFPPISKVTSQLYKQGKLLPATPDCVEDYALSQFAIEGGANVQLACSWNLPAGQDAVIAATLYGTRGGAAMRNINGSFYDFAAEHFEGTGRRLLAEPPDAWGERAIQSWVEQLNDQPQFSQSAQEFVAVMEIVDAIYAGDAALGRLNQRDQRSGRGLVGAAPGLASTSVGQANRNYGSRLG